MLLAPAPASGPTALVFVHAQRYAMGTMFDIVAYHASGPKAERAIEVALAEIVRLDHVLSHFDPESDLAKLVRTGRTGFVGVDPALYDVLSQSMEISRRSGGSFDVTVGPLVRLWQARADERPSAVAGRHRQGEALRGLRESAADAARSRCTSTPTASRSTWAASARATRWSGRCRSCRAPASSTRS